MDNGWAASLAPMVTARETRETRDRRLDADYEITSIR